MLRITRVEDEPFFLLPHKTSGPKGKVRRNHLPFYHAYATGLPDTVDALVFTSDLQGREAGRQNRLLGVPVAEALNTMIRNQEIPQPGGVCLCGDLYDYPDCHKLGGTGTVDEVYEAFAKVAPEIFGVMGNHDQLAEPDTLAANVHILDGDLRSVDKLTVGGVSGIVGNPSRNQRRTEADFLAAVEKVTRENPELLLLHQGPADEDRGRRGVPDVALSLATGYKGLTVFGHTRWQWPWLMTLGAGQVMNVDGRVVVLLKESINE